MESPLSNLEQREAKPYCGESETPLSLSLGTAVLVLVALVFILARVVGGAVGAYYEPFAEYGFPLGVALVLWGLARQSSSLRWVLGVPAKRQVLAQVRRAMVVGGYLPHDMALWSPHSFTVKLLPRERIVEVSYTGALSKAPGDLGAYLLETNATDAEFIDVVIPQRSPGQTVSFIAVLRYDLDREA